MQLATSLEITIGVLEKISLSFVLVFFFFLLIINDMMTIDSNKIALFFFFWCLSTTVVLRFPSVWNKYVIRYDENKKLLRESAGKKKKKTLNFLSF